MGQADETARARELANRIGGLHEVAHLVAKRAGQIELHAARNRAAGFDRGAENKLRHAARLRLIATFLADHRLHRAIGQNEELCAMLLEETPVGTQGSNYMTPHRIDAGVVQAEPPA